MSNWYDDSPPPGMVRVRPGDVFERGGRRYVAVMVNESRARLEPVDKVHVCRETRFGQRVEFDANGAGYNRSTTMEPGDAVEHWPAERLNEFLAGRARRRKDKNGLADNNDNETKGNEDMSMKSKGSKKSTPRDRTKDRGGLAADTTATAQSDTPKKTKAAGTMRPRAEDAEVVEVIKANPDFNDQKVVNAIRATGKGCSLARVEQLRKAA